MTFFVQSSFNGTTGELDCKPPKIQNPETAAEIDYDDDVEEEGGAQMLRKWPKDPQLQIKKVSKIAFGSICGAFDQAQIALGGELDANRCVIRDRVKANAIAHQLGHFSPKAITRSLPDTRANEVLTDLQTSLRC